MFTKEFDKICEDLICTQKSRFAEILNHEINNTRTELSLPRTAGFLGESGAEP